MPGCLLSTAAKQSHEADLGLNAIAKRHHLVGTAMLSRWIGPT
jgi:hypothetical protein